MNPKIKSKCMYCKCKIYSADKLYFSEDHGPMCKSCSRIYWEGYGACKKSYMGKIMWCISEIFKINIYGWGYTDAFGKKVRYATKTK